MTLFDAVFNKASIYDMFFFNIKSVLIYPTLDELEKKNFSLFNSWKELSKTKYGVDFYNQTTKQSYLEENYINNALNYPEFSKIVAITYALLYSENGEIKRHFKKIVDLDEYIVIATFMDVLDQISSDGIKSTPQYFPDLCGYNIINNDIPLLIKRFLIHKNKFENNFNLPYILKKALNFKPWESGVIDVINIWKFNGFDNISLSLISDFLGLKKTTELLTPIELSKYYWNNIDSKPKETLDFMSLQSATQTNLVIQLMNELRQI